MSTITTTMIDLMSRHALSKSQAALARAMERLSTGRRINRASDDPAGLIASERFEARQHDLQRRIESLEYDNHRLAARDGALGVLSDMAVELDGLVVAAANTAGMSEAEREALQVEADSLVQGISHVVSISYFNGEQLLGGYDASSLGALHTLAEGSGGEETVTTTLADLVTGGSINLLDGDLELAQRVVKKAVGQLSGARAAAGSRILSNESQIRASLAEFEGTAGALSGIRDADFAGEITALTRAQILEQAGIRTILMHRQNHARVLDLLW